MRKKKERKRERETNAEYDFSDWPFDTLIRDTNTDVWITCITHGIYGTLVLQYSDSARGLSTVIQMKHLY